MPRIIGILAACLLASLGGLVAQTPGNPDFSGSWELNEARSDDVRERLDDALRGLSSPPRSRAPRGGRNAGGSTDGSQALREQVEALLEGPRVVNVRHEDPELVIESALPDSPFEETVFTDGRPFARRVGSGQPLEATAGWQRGGRLVVELSLGSGHSVEETWELVADGSRVLVETEIAGKGLVPTIRVQRVYDRVEIVEWAVPD